MMGENQEENKNVDNPMEDVMESSDDLIDQILALYAKTRGKNAGKKLENKIRLLVKDFDKKIDVLAENSENDESIVANDRMTEESLTVIEKCIDAIEMARRRMESYIKKTGTTIFENLFNSHGQCIGTVYLYSDEKFSYGKNWREGLQRENKRANDLERELDKLKTNIAKQEEAKKHEGEYI